MQSPVASSPQQVVGAFRAALRVGDVAGVTRRLAAVARRPAERDVLVDLLDAEGPSEAVGRLQKFWSQTTSRVASTRNISDTEAEVFEDVSVKGTDKTLSVVTLTRKINDVWQVVSTHNAPDYRPRLMVLRGEGGLPLSDVTFSQQWEANNGNTAELVMLDGGGILGHPERGWLGGVRGPAQGAGVLPTHVTNALGVMSADATSIFEISANPVEDRQEQVELLIWLTQVAIAIAEQTRSEHIYSPGADRLLPMDAVRPAFAAGTPPMHTVATTWARLHRNDSFGFTRGMPHFHCPEVEYQASDWNDTGVAARCVISVASALISGKLSGRTGAVVRASGVRCHVKPGRRGPNVGGTYGARGAIRLTPIERQPVSQSGTVRKV